VYVNPSSDIFEVNLNPEYVKKRSLEINYHFKHGGSFWVMINPSSTKWWFVNQPIKKGGWTSKALKHPFLGLKNR